MTTFNEDLDKLRAQYDNLPYPQIPLERSPRGNETLDELFIHSLVTSTYLRTQTIPETTGKVILDAGCGSGYKALVLAEANPGAKIIGVDLSDESIQYARKRLSYHGFEANTEFHTMPLEDIAQLGIQFDYINCDEVIYLLPNLSLGLQALQSVLKSDGILRVNFHSQFQRQDYYRGQSLFKLMELTDDAPGILEADTVIAIMQSLKNEVRLKSFAWSENVKGADLNAQREVAMMNFLIQGDRGFTVPEVFDVLEQAQLDFISMVGWRHWELQDLFQTPDDLPMVLALGLPGLSAQEQFHLFELLHPVHRLIDLWCGHPQDSATSQPTVMTLPDWQTATIHLHPLLQHTSVKEKILQTIHTHQLCNLRDFIVLPSKVPVIINQMEAACLMPLFEGPQPFTTLVVHFMTLFPIDLRTFEPIDQAIATQKVQHLLSRLETYLYLLVERT